MMTDGQYYLRIAFRHRRQRLRLAHALQGAGDGGIFGLYEDLYYVLIRDNRQSYLMEYYGALDNPQKTDPGWKPVCTLPELAEFIVWREGREAPEWLLSFMPGYRR